MHGISLLVSFFHAIDVARDHSLPRSPFPSIRLSTIFYFFVYIFKWFMLSLFVYHRSIADGLSILFALLLDLCVLPYIIFFFFSFVHSFVFTFLFSWLLFRLVSILFQNIHTHTLTLMSWCYARVRKLKSAPTTKTSLRGHAIKAKDRDKRIQNVCVWECTRTWLCIRWRCVKFKDNKRKNM